MCPCAVSVQSRGGGPRAAHVLRAGMPRSCGQEVPAAGPPGTRQPRRAPGNRGSFCFPAGPRAGPGAAAGLVGEQRAATEYQVGTAPLRDLPRSSPRAAAAARLLQGPARRPPHTSPHGILAPTPPWWAALRLESSAAFHSLVIRDGGRAMFADRPRGPPITLRTRYILIHDGGELHLGWERCSCRSRATISLDGRAAEGAAVKGFGQKFVGLGRGGVLELHGGRPRSWTLLDKTPRSGGLPHGSSSSEQQRGSRGINPRTLDAGSGRALAAGRFDTQPGSPGILGGD